MGTVHTLLRFEKDPKDTIKSWFEESKTTEAQLCHGLGADRRSLLSKFYITIDREAASEEENPLQQNQYFENQLMLITYQKDKEDFERFFL